MSDENTENVVVEIPTPLNKVAKRLGSVLGKRWTPVPIALLENYKEMGLAAQEAMFLIHLLSLKKNDLPFQARLRQISDKMNVSYPTIRRFADNCKSRGLLRVIVRKGYPNQYDLKPLLLELEEREAKRLANKKKQEEESE
jgi:hypothetical protein